MSDFYEDDIFQKERYPNFEIANYLEDNDFEIRSHDSDGHEELAVNCPQCIERGESTPDQKKKLWINKDKGKFYCYRCKWSGDLPWLIRTVSKVPLDKAMEILRGKVLDPMEHLGLRLYSEDVLWESDDLEIRSIDLPYGYQKFERSHPYLEKRGIPHPHIIKNDWGLGVAGFCRDRIIVPTFMEERLVFWQARATWEDDDKDFKKVLNPRGVSARKVLYNYDEAKNSELIYITEGFIDCCKVGDNAVATNGKTLHADQVAWLEQTKAKKIVLAWDADAWTDGTKKKPSSIQRAADMLKMKFEVFAVKFPEGRDPGSYSYNSPELKKIIDKLYPL